MNTIDEDSHEETESQEEAESPEHSNHGELEELHPLALKGEIRHYEEMLETLKKLDRQNNSYFIWGSVQRIQLRKKISGVEAYLADPSKTDPLQRIGKDTVKFLKSAIPKWKAKLDVLDDLVLVSVIHHKKCQSLMGTVDGILLHLSKHVDLHKYLVEDTELYRRNLRGARVLINEQEVTRQQVAERYAKAIEELLKINQTETGECNSLLRSAESGRTGDLTPQNVKEIFRIAEIPLDSSSIYLDGIEHWEKTNRDHLLHCTMATDSLTKILPDFVSYRARCHDAISRKDKALYDVLRTQLWKIDSIKKALRGANEALSKVCPVFDMAENQEYLYNQYKLNLELMRLSANEIFSSYEAEITRAGGKLFLDEKDNEGDELNETMDEQ